MNQDKKERSAKKILDEFSLDSRGNSEECRQTLWCECSQCDGSKQVLVYDGFGEVLEVPCFVCDGLGKVKVKYYKVGPDGVALEQL